MVVLNVILFLVFCAIQSYDIYTTYFILKKGGTELNPFIKKVMAKIGVLPGLLIVKGLHCVILGVFAYFYMSTFIMLAALIVSIFLSFLIVIHNYKQLKRR